jgi:DNA-binding protein Fis
MTKPVVKGNSYILVHAANSLLHHGSTQVSERNQNPDSDYLQKLPEFLTTYEDALNYPANQTYIGNLSLEELEETSRPWYENEVESAERFSDWGEIMPEEEFYGLMQVVDVFDLVKLTEDFAKEAKDKLAEHPVLAEYADEIEGEEAANIKELVADEVAEPLYLNQDELVGCVKQAHKTDVNLSSHVMLENMVTKASGVLAMLNLGKQ